jgi:hypothetical protein
LVLLVMAAGAGCGWSASAGWKAELTLMPLSAPVQPLAPHSAAQVDVYLSARPWSKRYVDVGVISADWCGMSSDALADLRAFAGEKGCDGIIEGSDAPYETEHGTTCHDLFFTCIVYTSAAETSQR